MGGALLQLRGGSTGGSSRLSYSGTVTVGTQVYPIPKDGSITEHGYAIAALSATGVAFGSTSPGTMSGFTIDGIYWSSSSVSGITTTYLVLAGDASAYGATMTIGGVNQNLGPGSYDGSTYTTFNSGSAQANPFGGDGTMSAIVVS